MSFSPAPQGSVSKADVAVPAGIGAGTFFRPEPQPRFSAFAGALATASAPSATKADLSFITSIPCQSVKPRQARSSSHRVRLLLLVPAGGSACTRSTGATIRGRREQEICRYATGLRTGKDRRQAQGQGRSIPSHGHRAAEAPGPTRYCAGPVSGPARARPSADVPPQADANLVRRDVVEPRARRGKGGAD